MSERPLGEVFDDVAEDHDRVRAGYPSELVASALDQAASLTGRVEVGCGTRKLIECRRPLRKDDCRRAASTPLA